jgi:hypothetical protein
MEHSTLMFLDYLKFLITGFRIIADDFYCQTTGRLTESIISRLFDDDNIRKPISRLYLNGNKKYIGTFDEHKKETKVEFIALDDLYTYADQIIRLTRSCSE